MARIDVVRGDQISPEDADKLRKQNEERVAEFANILETVDLDMGDVNLEQDNLNKVDMGRLNQDLFEDMRQEMRRGAARRDET